MAEHLFVRFQHLSGRFIIIDIARRQANQLLFAFAGQQLHRAVAAGELFIDVAIEHQVRRGIQEGAQEGGLLFQLNLCLLTTRYLFAQLIHHLFACQLRLFTIADLLIQLRNGLFHLLIEFQIAGTHLFQLIHQPCQSLP